MAAFAWWCNDQVSDGANPPKVRTTGMKLAEHLNLAGWGLLLLTFGLSPNALPGQSQNQAQDQTAKPPSAVPSAVSPATPHAPDEGCANRNLSMEQMEDQQRSMDGGVNQEMLEDLAGLSERVQKEV